VGLALLALVWIDTCATPTATLTPTPTP
jgi:hypothetical protein